MHDPKFEQEVQRRMHDLEFVPSESVWAGIQQGIAPRERRRAVAVLWWLFPGMLLLAGGIAMYRHSASTGGVAAAVPAVGTGKPAGAAGNGNGGSVTGNDIAGSGGVIAGNEGAGVVAGSGAGSGAAGVADVVIAGGDEGTVEGAAAASRASLGRYWPEMIRGMASRRGVDAPPLEWQPVNTAVSGVRRPRHPWTAGFAVGGGAASVYSRGGAGLVSSPMPGNYLSSGGYGVSNVAAPSSPRAGGSSFFSALAGSKQNKTYVQPGYSYWAGFYGEKRLSARWSVDIGLNLHYYSARFETTNPVLFYAPPSSASLFAATSLTYTTSSANTNTGGELQTYYNRYYFLEVPATVQWRLNHSRSLPLFWRGGAVLSYLMSSNGLYYDNVTGDVEKDNGVVRHTQASVQSGLMVGLPVRGVQLQAGPEVQYALTSMLTTASGGGHMVYGGMRVTLMR